MPLEEAIKQLELYAKKLEEVGDVKTFIQTNKEEFLHRYAKVSQYYHYIEKNSNMGDLFFEAVNILSDIAINNPSLEEFIFMMIEPKKQKEAINVQEPIQQNDKVAELTNQIDQLIKDMNERGYHLEELGDMEWALNTKREELINLKDSFDISEYERLLNAIDIKLKNIDILNQQYQSVDSSYSY